MLWTLWILRARVKGGKKWTVITLKSRRMAYHLSRTLCVIWEVQLSKLLVTTLLQLTGIICYIPWAFEIEWKSLLCSHEVSWSLTSRPFHHWNHHHIAMFSCSIYHFRQKRYRRQLVQQYAKNLAGETVAPAVASAEAKAGGERFHFLTFNRDQSS